MVGKRGLFTWWECVEIQLRAVRERDPESAGHLLVQRNFFSFLFFLILILSLSFILLFFSSIYSNRPAVYLIKEHTK